MKKILLFLLIAVFILSCGGEKKVRIIHLKYGDLQIIRALPIVINSSGNQDEASLYIQKMMEDGLKKLDRFEYHDLNNWLLMREKPETIVKINKIRKSLENVAVYYQSLKIEKSTNLVETLLKHYNKNFQFFEDLEEYFTIKSYQAASNMLGDGINTDKIFQEIAVVNPKFKLNTKAFSPEIVNQYTRATKNVFDFNRGTIAVNSEPIARVYLDGEFAGITPFYSKQVKVGKHYVKVEAEGYLPYGKIVNVLPQENAVNAALSPFDSKRKLTILTKKLVKVLSTTSKLLPREVLKMLHFSPFDQLLFLVTKTVGQKVYIDLYVFDIPTTSMYLHNNFSINLENSNFEDTFFTHIERTLNY